MAGVSALRDAAREAIFAAGGRGFVRFCAQGPALLVSDACRRGDAGALMRALEAAGFCAGEHAGLLHIAPGDEMLLALCAAQREHLAVDWESPLFEAQALCARLLKEARLPLDAGGRQLALDAMRLLWQDADKAAQGLPALREAIAVRLREGKKSGLYETGRLLCGWLEQQA